MRIGGACAVLAALAVVPAYVVGSPETPRTAEDIRRYFHGAASFLTANGTLPMLHVLLCLVFLGSLVALLRTAAPGSISVVVVLAAGCTFVGLTAVGLAAEVAVPAAIVSFGDVTVAQYSQPFLGLAIWVYHFSQVAAALMIGATGLLIWRTSVLPRFAAAFSVLGVVSLLHLWFGVFSAYATIGWLILIGVVMVARPPSPASREAGLL
jgi:hypothetical protein